MFLGEEYFYYNPIFRFCKKCKKVEKRTDYGWVRLSQEEIDVFFKKLSYEMYVNKFVISEKK